MSDAAQYKRLYKKYKAKCVDLKSKNCALEQELDGLYNGYGGNECLTMPMKELLETWLRRSSMTTSVLPKKLFVYLHTGQAIITVQKDQASSCDVRQGFQPASTHG